MCARLIRHPRGFVRDEDGSATIEAVLWLPIFVFLMLVITDASLAFFGKAEAFRIMQDANRSYSVGKIDTVDDVENAIRGAYASFSSGEGLIIDTTEENGIVSTTMQIPASDLMLFDTFNVSTGWKITVRAQHFVES